MSNLWIPRDFRDPEKVTENLPGKPLALDWGGTGVAATDLAALKTYLGIGGASDNLSSRMYPLRRVQATSTVTAAMDTIGESAITPTYVSGSPGTPIAPVTANNVDGSFLKLVDDAYDVGGPYFAAVNFQMLVQRRWAPDAVFVFKPQIVLPSASVPRSGGRLWVGFSPGPISALTPPANTAALRWNPIETGAPPVISGDWEPFTVTNGGAVTQGAATGVSGSNDGLNAVRIRCTDPATGTWEFSCYDFGTAEWIILSTQTGGPNLTTTLVPFISMGRQAAEADIALRYKTLEVKVMDLVQE